MNEKYRPASVCTSESDCSARDYFAGVALGAYLQIGGIEGIEALGNASPESAAQNLRNMAQLCYGFADAMIKQRNKEPNRKLTDRICDDKGGSER